MSPFKTKNLLISYRLDQFWQIRKNNNKLNYWKLLAFFSYFIYWVLIIVGGIWLPESFFIQKIHFSFNQMFILLFLIFYAVFGTSWLKNISKLVAAKYALALYSMGIKRNDVFGDRFIPYVWRIMLTTIPIVVFGLLIATNKWLIVLLACCLWVYILLVYSMRLMMINIMRDVIHAKFVDLWISIVTFTLAFIYVPTTTIIENHFWMQYFQYFSPIGWLNLLIFNSSNYLLQPYLYLYFVLIPITICMILLAKKTTLL